MVTARVPSSRAIASEGRLIFALQATSSAWPISGRYQEMHITGTRAAAAIAAGEVYWWEPD